MSHINDVTLRHKYDVITKNKGILNVPNYNAFVTLLGPDTKNSSSSFNRSPNPNILLGTQPKTQFGPTHHWTNPEMDRPTWVESKIGQTLKMDQPLIGTDPKSPNPTWLFTLCVTKFICSEFKSSKILSLRNKMTHCDVIT